jgi:uncharacterized protein YdaU (DUF1376 family)
MDAIYDREQFPTKQEAIDWTWASTQEEVEAVEFVLKKFFTNGNGVYHQKRIEEEINAFQSRSEINARIAKERETKRAKQSTKRARSDHESPPNHKPLTINHKPEWLNATAWDEFEQHRKDIRQPLSDLARTKAQNQLKDLTFDQQAIVIDKTIQNRWRGLFPEKLHGTHQQSDKPQSHNATVWNAIKSRAQNE